MQHLSSSELDTVTNFLRERLEPEYLKQVVEILTRNTEVETAVDGGTIDPANGAGAMDERRRFEKQNGMPSRRIRNLG